MRASSPLRIAAAAGAVAACGLLGTSSYTVRPGDTLSAIAAQQGTSVDALVSSNGITDPNFILIGDQLTIPASSSGVGISSSGSGGGAVASAPSGGSYGSYLVQPGDTILGIALAKGISTEQLVAANGLVDGWIYENQRLSLGPALDPGPAITCPVPGASFVNDWGFPRDGHAHAGNDLFAPAGTPLYAPRAGLVEASWGSIGGKSVRLATSDGMHYHATHLGDFGATGWVEQGDVIGYVGSSGNARGGPAHVHFEVEPDGVTEISPYPLLVDACR